ncbi:30S ribosomal protein S19e [Halobacteriales archaeon QS_8_69_26]|nr:MAG: 30S ribosomal protein S19e [Halobacteriales archaeon QS_8_69_26]
MATMYDVPVEALIEAVAEDFADRDAIARPDWAQFVKSGSNRELPPEQEDFWERRAASVLRKVAKDGPVGVGRLRTEYGGAKQGSNRYRVAGTHRSDASGKVIREILVQLEKADLVRRAEGEGRRITPEGQSFLDDTAEEVIEDLDRPELDRYA